MRSKLSLSCLRRFSRCSTLGARTIRCCKNLNFPGSSPGLHTNPATCCLSAFNYCLNILSTSIHDSVQAARALDSNRVAAPIVSILNTIGRSTCRYFNAVQSESFAETFLSDVNMVVSAPTGSGKTVLFELCMLRLLSRNLTLNGRYNHVPGALKMVYIAPLKALVQEKVRDWEQRFGQLLGLKCQELTGDTTEFFNIRDMQATDIFLTTPEKFDSLTRRHRDHGVLSFFGDIALLLIDEVHLLSDPRGAALEAVVSRMKMLSRYPELKGCPIASIRMMAVSATIANIEDLAEWLQAPRQGIKRFGEETRPVKLTTKVYGYAPAKNDFLFERRLQDYLYDIVTQHNQGKPALVFCSTRKGAQEAAAMLAETVSKLGAHNPFIKSQEQLDRLQAAASVSQDKHMQECLKSGVGYHNGGLGLTERSLVEGLFLKGDLQVLCTTNTLAQGVNLPAHLVIIKSTQYFNKDKGGYIEYERSTVSQMCGRAGRPQFDDSGAIVIMTRKQTVHLYENILAGTEPVESQLLPSVAEHLNAEIVLMTVTDVSLAIDWLKCSFLYIRLRKNPRHYDIGIGLSDDQLENYLKDMCLRNITALAKYGIIQTDEYGYVLNPLEPGRLMTKFYLKFATMKTIVDCAPGSAIEGLLQVLARADELSWIKLRRHEKKMLNTINQDTSGRIKYHVLGANGKVKKRIQSDADKIFVLTNDALSGEPAVQDFSMSQDVNAICTNGSRITRCMSEYFKFKNRFKESLGSLKLAKCLQLRLWDDSRYQLKQLPGIGVVTAKALVNAGIDTLEKFADADPRRLEAITGRKFPYGNHIKESLDNLPPKLSLNLECVSQYCSQGKAEVRMTLKRESECSLLKRHFADLIVGSEQDNKILLKEKIRLEHFTRYYKVAAELLISRTTAVPYTTTLKIVRSELGLPSEITAAVVPEEYVGVDLVEKLIFGPQADGALPQQRTRRKTSTKTKQAVQKPPDPVTSPRSEISFIQPLGQGDASQTVQVDEAGMGSVERGTPIIATEDTPGESDIVILDEDSCDDERTVLVEPQTEDARTEPNEIIILDEEDFWVSPSEQTVWIDTQAENAGTEPSEIEEVSRPLSRKRHSDPMSNASQSRARLAGEGIFDHIRMKAKTFLVTPAQQLRSPAPCPRNLPKATCASLDFPREAFPAKSEIVETSAPVLSKQVIHIPEVDELDEFALSYRSPPRSPPQSPPRSPLRSPGRSPSRSFTEPESCRAQRPTTLPAVQECQDVRPPGGHLEVDRRYSSTTHSPSQVTPQKKCYNGYRSLPPWDMRGTLVDGLSIFSLLCLNSSDSSD